MTRASEALAATLLALGLLGGCAVGPDFLRPRRRPSRATRRSRSRPRPPRPMSRAAQAQRFVAGLDIPGEWWTLFHSAPLDALIAEALKANPDLEAAQAALRQAQENVYAERGRAVSRRSTATAPATREKVSGAAFGQPGHLRDLQPRDGDAQRLLSARRVRRRAAADRIARGRRPNTSASSSRRPI